MFDETFRATDKEFGNSRIAGRKLGLATEIEGDVLDVGGFWEVEYYVPR